MEKKTYAQPLASVFVFSPEIMGEDLVKTGPGSIPDLNSNYDAPVRNLYV